MHLVGLDHLGRSKRETNFPNGQNWQVVQVRDMAGQTRLCPTMHPSTACTRVSLSALNPDGKARSPEAFARLIERARNRHKEDTLSIMVEEVYGLPLSATDREIDSLEWRFLDFVAK